MAPALLALLLAGAPASPQVALAPAAARPGDAVLVAVSRAAEPPRGSLAGRPLTFWRDGARWLAMAALPLETPVGVAPLEIEAGAARTTAELAIVEPGFPARNISGIPKQFVEPPPEVSARIAADRKAFAAAYARPFEPPRFSRRFAWPRKARLSGRFGDQRLMNGEKQSVHYGTDVTGPRGSPIGAANDGEVVLVRDAYLSGKTVVIAHGGGIFTAYFHLDRIDVPHGARVRRGQRIGRLGSTGRSTGPHLHLGARVDGLFVDAESLLAIDFVRATAPARPPRLPTPPTGAPLPPTPDAPAQDAPAPAPPSAPSPARAEGKPPSAGVSARPAPAR
jgi:murein DD-endopeptidase MepM/ murein hydrolase activator NlpD